jgi:hypothetical protein
MVSWSPIRPGVKCHAISTTVMTADQIFHWDAMVHSSECRPLVFRVHLYAFSSRRKIPPLKSMGPTDSWPPVSTIAPVATMLVRNNSIQEVGDVVAGTRGKLRIESHDIL